MEYEKSDVKLLRKVNLNLRLKYCPYNNLLYLGLPATSTVIITNRMYTVQLKNQDELRNQISCCLSTAEDK